VAFKIFIDRIKTPSCKKLGVFFRLKILKTFFISKIISFIIIEINATCWLGDDSGVEPLDHILELASETMTKPMIVNRRGLTRLGNAHAYEWHLKYSLTK
jgi:hypothetical protein